jgi:hypothetical protein
MWGWIIAAVGLLVVTHKASATGASDSGTVVNAAPIPSFGVVNANSSDNSVISREPLHTTFTEWQNGPEVPVPSGSRADLHAIGIATSDAKSNMISQLQVYGVGPDVRNPESKRLIPGGGGAAASGGGTGAAPSGGGAPAGGFGGSGGFIPGNRGILKL